MGQTVFGTPQDMHYKSGSCPSAAIQCRQRHGNESEAFIVLEKAGTQVLVGCHGSTRIVRRSCECEDLGKACMDS